MKNFMGLPVAVGGMVSIATLRHKEHLFQPFAKTGQAVGEEGVLEPYYVQGEQTPPWWSIPILLEMLALALPGRRGGFPI